MANSHPHKIVTSLREKGKKKCKRVEKRKEPSKWRKGMEKSTREDQKGTNPSSPKQGKSISNCVNGLSFGFWVAEIVKEKWG